MNRIASSPADRAATDRPIIGLRTADFETAQHRLFDAVELDVRSRFVELDRPRVRTHVFEAGPLDESPERRDADPPLLFVHGGGSFGAFLAPLVAELDDQRVVAFDRPGYGLSDGFRYSERDLRRTDVDVLDGIVDDLGVDRVDLVGHSMGGYASVRFALARPDRVRRLVLIGACAAFPGTRVPLPLRLTTVPLLDRLIELVQRPDEAGVLDVAAIFGERDAVRDRPALLRAMVAHERDPKSVAARESEHRAFFSIRGWHPTIRLTDADLRTLEQPTLLVWGERDPLGAPDDVRAAVRSIPDARLETVPTGHVPWLTYPDRCADLVRAFRTE